MAQKGVTDAKGAGRLARAIASDISIYNEKLILKGLMNDNLWELLEGEMAEAYAHFESRVPKELRDEDNYLEKAMVDIILRAKAHVDSPIW